MKRLLWLLLILPLFFLSVWVGVNLMPVPMEKPLWTTADLPSTEHLRLYSEAEFQKKLAQGSFREKNLDIPENILALIIEIPDPLEPDFTKNAESYWEKVKENKVPLEKFLQSHQQELKDYADLLEGPEWISPHPLSIEKRGEASIALLDLHKMYLLQMLHEAILGNWEKTYALWSKGYRKNITWITYSLSIISRFVGLTSIQNDVSILSIFALHHSPPKVLLNEIGSFDWSQMSLKPALICEYLIILQLVDQMKAETKGVKDSLRFSLFYSDQGTLNLLNKIGRAYADLQADPSKVTPDFDEKLRRTLKLYKAHPLWWFQNPIGKLMAGITHVSLADRIGQFEVAKNKVKERITILLKS